MNIRIPVGLALALTLLTVPLHADPPTTAKAPTTTRPVQSYDAQVKGRVTQILDELQTSADYDAAYKQLQELFDQVVACAPEKQVDAFRETYWALRLVAQLQRVEAPKRSELLKLLRAAPELGHTLPMLLGEHDSIAGAYGVLDRLRTERARDARDGGDLEKYAQLVAALCVVHDRPFTRQINEVSLKSPDVVELFDYYTKNESAMFFGIQKVPAELLIYVVDTTATVEEMKWAAAKYGKDPQVGRHFFDIKYDHEYFRTGKDKKIAKVEYNLPNLLKVGGVCADQAYFAMAVGKAIGVPTAYATGRSADVGHAWVGFLQADGRRGWWNFDVGRYAEYRGVMGLVLDPQTGERIPDSYVSLTAELIGTKPTDRQNAAALTAAAGRIVALAKRGEEWKVEAPALTPGAGVPRKDTRKISAESALELLEAALGQSVGYAPAWFAARDLASDGKLTLAQKKRWSDALLTRCGQQYPDFALAVLTPMIETVEETSEQNALWNAVFVKFQARQDLAAGIRMAQARMWENANEPAKAGQCYMDVVDRYANAGPFVLPALDGAEKLLRATGKEDKVIVLYGDTWNKTAKPQDMAGPFMQQSNWYRVGVRYVAKLLEAGKVKEADAVSVKLGNAVGAAK